MGLTGRGRRREVGFWREEPKPEHGAYGLLAALMSGGYPDVRRFVDPGWDWTERMLVARYVADPRFRGPAYFGYSTCRLCGKNNGTCDMTDGTYTWPEGFGHYITEHMVKPPRDFIMHIRKQVRV